MSASAAVNARKSVASPAASGATTDADMIAMVELVVTRKCLLVPNRA